jgi:Amt family ammonium transporter
MKKLLALLALLLTPVSAFAADAIPTINGADTVWVMVSAALVFLMIPGLALFYGGLVRKKNILSTMMHSLVAFPIIGITWVVIGYTNAFGPDIGNKLIGNLQHMFLQGITLDSVFPGYAIPTYVFFMFQLMFAVITPALISGAIAERVKFSSYCVFLFFWGLLIYNPLAHWVWGGGFLTGRALDFAGGTVVHISSGISALALLLFLGKRRNFPAAYTPPHSLPLTLIGAGLLWFGWFGFNAGSALAANAVASLAFINTFLAPAAAMAVWLILDRIFLGKPTALGAGSGMLAGLVGVTPAAGFVEPIYAIAIGVIATLICFTAVTLKNKFSAYDDSLDVFGIHGVGGITGAILTGVFATVNAKGLILGNSVQLMNQLEAVLVTIAYAFIGTLVIGFLINITMGLRVSDSDENVGLDQTQHGESGYHM